MKEMIHQPKHYCSNGEETIVKIVRELGINGAMIFCKGNIIKYADRAEYKGQKEDDLQKIKEYTKMANDLDAIRMKFFKHYANANTKISMRIWKGLIIWYVKKWSENGHSLEFMKKEK